MDRIPLHSFWGEVLRFRAGSPGEGDGGLYSPLAVLDEVEIKTAMILALLLLAQCVECNATAWELQINGETIIEDIETEGECIALRDQLDPQSPAFTRLECVEVGVIRHDA